jgi:cysteine-rich PDZ-binding protein
VCYLFILDNLPQHPIQFLTSVFDVMFQIMVCGTCQSKVSKVITPDPWKSGARNTNESGGRKINENKALTSRARASPYGTPATFEKCRICKSKIHQQGAYYCQVSAALVINLFVLVMLVEKEWLKNMCAKYTGTF